MGVEGVLVVKAGAEVDVDTCFILFFTFLGGSSLLEVSPETLALLDERPLFMSTHGLRFI